MVIASCRDAAVNHYEIFRINRCRHLNANSSYHINNYTILTYQKILIEFKEQGKLQ